MVLFKSGCNNLNFIFLKGNSSVRLYQIESAYTLSGDKASLVGNTLVSSHPVYLDVIPVLFPPLHDNVF